MISFKQIVSKLTGKGDVVKDITTTVIGMIPIVVNVIKEVDTLIDTVKTVIVKLKEN